MPNSNTAVLLIHGILGGPEHFADFIPRIPAQWSIFNILLDGHGKTVDDFAASSMDRWKQQVAATVSEMCEQYENLVVVAHSMGTLFAIDRAIQTPKIRALFLLAVPLRAGVKPAAVKNSLQITFNRLPPDSPRAKTTQRAYSITPDRRLWKYIRWIPNYWALLQEMWQTRDKISRLKTPCQVFQSGKDELVAASSARYFAASDAISCTVLPRSSHFYYDEEDYASLLYAFEAFCYSACK